MAERSTVKARRTSWNALAPRAKVAWFVLIVIVAWFIRMADPLYGVLFSIFYIAVVRMLYSKADYKEFLGFNKPSGKSIGFAFVVVAVMVAVFLPFYVLSPLCPMHLFDPILLQIDGLLGGNVVLTILVMCLAICTFTVYAEELFFRAFIQDAIDGFAGLGRGKGLMKLDRRRATTLLWSNLLFGVAHVNLLWDDIFRWHITAPDFAFMLVGVLSLSAAGYLFGVLRVTSDSIWPAVVAHVIGNFFQVALPAVIVLT
ncbi:MAG: CPBP family intramembrane metalloprotease [Candidatus Lokiarchaeota archaeon]|nr:CPBP family intramembrane metalloprotease [Candidatus Lokiarchaeota archaeon]